MASKLTVAFWNVRNLFELGATKRAPATQVELDTKLDTLERVLRRIGPPDLLALAEVATARLAAELVGRVYGKHQGLQLVSEFAKDPSSTGIVIAGSSKIAQIRTIAVDRGTGGGRPRAVWSEVELAGKSERLLFAACHWKSDLRYGPLLPSHDRAASARWLEAKVGAAGRFAPVLVIGDLNTDPFSPEMMIGLRSCRHYSSTVRGRLFATQWPWLAEPDDYSTTRAQGYHVSRPRGTFAGSPPRVLDQLLVSRALLDGRSFRLEQSSIRVHADVDTSVVRATGHIEPHGASDHFPIVLNLSY